MAIASLNPATGEKLKEFPALDEGEIANRLGRAERAFQKYRRLAFSERSEMLEAAAELLLREKEKFARIITLEMGKLFRDSVAEIEKCARACRFYADNGERFLEDEVTQTDAAQSYVQYQPLGPVLAIMPWNFPFWQVFRFAAPGLMAGNVGLLKHSSNVPQCALAIEEIFCRAGFPPGVFETLLIDSGRVDAVLQDERIAAATLTGSEPAGRAVAGRAGSLIKKTVLELGGSDPFIVMPSADLESTVKAAVAARTINNGQSCIAAKRFIVAEGIYSDFEKRFVEKMRALHVGDPMKPDTDIGPLATARIRDDLHDQVTRAQNDGATVLTGGKPIEGAGNYYAPTVLANIPRNSAVFYEELFGPVAMLFRVKDTGAAIELANDSPFGLGSSVWTNDAAEAEQFIDGIEAGQVFVNAPVASDPRLPFGGVKRSGYGRELSEVGIHEFVNIKTVWCK